MKLSAAVVIIHTDISGSCFHVDDAGNKRSCAGMGKLFQCLRR